MPSPEGMPLKLVDKRPKKELEGWPGTIPPVVIPFSLEGHPQSPGMVFPVALGNLLIGTSRRELV